MASKTSRSIWVAGWLVAACGGGGSGRAADKTAVVAAYASLHECMVTADGKVRCSGKGEFGELGAPPSKNWVTTPVEVPGITDAIDVAVGNRWSAAVTRGGKVFMWGETDMAGKGSEKVVEVKELQGATDLEGDLWALFADGSVASYRRQVGDRPATATKVTMPAGFSAKQLRTFASESTACVADAAGAVACTSSFFDSPWGAWASGKDRTAFHLVPGLVGARDVAVTRNGVCALLAGSTVACFGFGLGKDVASTVEVPGVSLLESIYSSDGGAVFAVRGPSERSNISATGGALAALADIAPKAEACPRKTTIGSHQRGCVLCASGGVQCPSTDGPTFPLGK